MKRLQLYASFCQIFKKYCCQTVVAKPCTAHGPHALMRLLDTWILFDNSTIVFICQLAFKQCFSCLLQTPPFTQKIRMFFSNFLSARNDLHLSISVSC